MPRTQLSIGDRFVRAFDRHLREARNPKPVSKEDLFRKVISGATSIGIEDAVVHEWDKNRITSWFTSGVVRERRYLQSLMRQDRERDIGYFIDRCAGYFTSSGIYTVRSFEINAFAFSDDKYEEFFMALIRQGLKPEQYHPFGTIFYTEEEIRTWGNKTPLYGREN